jgi:hypothetical protein
MNLFAASASRMLTRFGTAVTFKAVTVGAYDTSLGTATNSFANSTVTAYKKQIAATQYNFPDQIGKELAEFYIHASSFPSSKPKVGDKITEGTNTFTIVKVSEHGAYGEIILFCLIGVK